MQFIVISFMPIHIHVLMTWYRSKQILGLLQSEPLVLWLALLLVLAPLTDSIHMSLQPLQVAPLPISLLRASYKKTLLPLMISTPFSVSIHFAILLNIVMPPICNANLTQYSSLVHSFIMFLVSFSSKSHGNLFLVVRLV